VYDDTDIVIFSEKNYEQVLTCQKPVKDCSISVLYRKIFPSFSSSFDHTRFTRGEHRVHDDRTHKCINIFSYWTIHYKNYNDTIRSYLCFSLFSLHVHMYMCTGLRTYGFLLKRINGFMKVKISTIPLRVTRLTNKLYDIMKTERLK
jgi:hypothetical protein